MADLPAALTCVHEISDVAVRRIYAAVNLTRGRNPRTHQRSWSTALPLLHVVQLNDTVKRLHVYKVSILYVNVLL